MAFIPVPNVAQVEIVYSFEGSIMENVTHYAGNDVSNPTVLTGLATDMQLQWKDAFRGAQSSSLTCIKTRATSLESQNAPGVEVPCTSNNAGQISGTYAPANVCVLIQLITAYRGRSYRGRLYVPGIPESTYTGSYLDPTYVTAFNNCYSFFDFLDVSGEPYAMVVVSRYHNGAPRAEGIYTPVDAFSTSTVLASQRRRLPGRGM